MLGDYRKFSRRQIGYDRNMDRNNFNLLCAVVIGWLGLLAPTYGETYYVDPKKGSDLNAGSKASPWKSVPGSRSTSDATLLPNRKLLPGDLIEVKRGSAFGAFTNVGRLEFTQSGAPGKPILIRCAPRWGDGTCSFNGTGTTLPPYSALVAFKDSAFVSFDGFIVSKSTQSGIAIVGNSHHLTIDGNIVNGARARGIEVGVTTPATQPLFLRMVNNRISNSDSGGIVLWTALGGYVLIENNTFTDVNGAGNFDIIQVGSASHGTHHVVVRNNVIVGGGKDGDPIDTSGHGITHNILIEGNKVINSDGNLKFHCAVSETSLGPGYDQTLYGQPGSAGWYAPGVSCHIIVRNNIWKNQQLHIYNFPFPIVYYNNTSYRESGGSPQILPGRSCHLNGEAVAHINFGDTTYPGGGSEKGVFSLKNNIWWSESGNSPIALYQAGCKTMPAWNFNYDSIRTKNNLFKNPQWQRWYGLQYPTSVKEVQTKGNSDGNRPETGSVQTTIPALKAFMNIDADDYSPTEGSPAREIGTWLTTIRTGVTNSAVVSVDRATYFFDGYCVKTECLGTPDWIRIGTNPPVQVNSVNAISHTLTLSHPVTGAANDPISLAIHPIQETVLFGHRPDIGARAYIYETK